MTIAGRAAGKSINALNSLACRSFCRNHSKPPYRCLPWFSSLFFGTPITKRATTKIVRVYSSGRSQYESEAFRESKKDASLRKLATPFLLQCHPDRSHQSLPLVSRNVNLAAVQTLNGLIDLVEQVVARANSPSVQSVRLEEIKGRYVIEFMVPSNNASDSKQDDAVATRRSVDLVFPQYVRNQAMSVTDSRYSVRGAEMLRTRARAEIAKLLKVAGLTVPNLDYHDDDDDERVRMEELQDYFLKEELGLEDDDDDNSSVAANAARTRFSNDLRKKKKKPSSKFEDSKQQFFRTMDWKKYHRVYNQAIIDMKADIATSGMIKYNERRKQEVVAHVLSRVRIFDPCVDDNNNNNSDISSLEDNDLDIVQQLIATRRLSLLFSDYFEELQMEDMGRMWEENLVIVLTPSRSSPSYIRGVLEKERQQNKGDDGVPFISKRNRKNKGRDSGFKFAHSSNNDTNLDSGGGTVTVYVPIDFTEQELIGEMNRHLGDFNELVGGKHELDEFLPSFLKDMIVE